jgi:hypothetical protein
MLVAIGGTQLNRIDVAENRPYMWHKREANYLPTRTPLGCRRPLARVGCVLCFVRAC